MASLLPPSIVKLIEAFATLPGIGPKTAQRLVFHLLRSDKTKTRRIADASAHLFEGLDVCQNCTMLAVTELCPICASLQRDHSVICVVAHSYDVVALEEAGQFTGVYHVLGGELSPLDGIGPDELTISALMQRAEQQDPPVREIILATNPTLEGEATALYIAKLLQGTSHLVTRIARGIPVGGDLEYANTLTLGNAMHDRMPFSSQ